MPLYEYRCQRCDRQFEELVFGAAQPACPACGNGDVERLLSVVSPGTTRKASAAPTPCGTCGDVRGPGACRS